MSRNSVCIYPIYSTIFAIPLTKKIIQTDKISIIFGLIYNIPI